MRDRGREIFEDVLYSQAALYAHNPELRKRTDNHVRCILDRCAENS